MPGITSNINISNITKDNFSSKVYENKTDKIFFCICFCPTIAYAFSVMPMLMSMLMSKTSQHFFVLPFGLACACVDSVFLDLEMVP